MSKKQPLSWKVRKWLWSSWQTFRMWVNKPTKIVAPKPNKTPIKPIPMREKYPKIPVDILVYDKLPKDENKLTTRIFVTLQLFLNRLFSPMQRNLPEIDTDIKAALEDASIGKYEQSYRAPVIPPIYDGDGMPELEDLAVKSPYAIYLERDAQGILNWDFSELGEFEHHEDLSSLGLRVVFAEDSDSGRLEATEISGEEHGTVRRGDSGWDRAKDSAVCAATTHMALTRHFNYIHLVSGNHWDITARNKFNSDHPLFRLMWPSLYNSLYTNDGVTRPQLNPDGDFVNMFSFTHKGLTDYFNAMHKKYNIALLDPEADWKRRGLDGSQFATPTQDNICQIFKVMHDHASRYIDAYYESDEALQEDKEVQDWIKDLRGMIPNGLGHFSECGESREQLARLIGGYIHEGNVMHDMAGTTLWDYQLWVDRNPVRVHRDGRRIPLDVLQRTINNNFALQLRRAPLLANYKQVALDSKGEAAFTKFFEDCTALQAQYDKETTGPWRMEPKNLEISMNG